MTPALPSASNTLSGPGDNVMRLVVYCRCPTPALFTSIFGRSPIVKRMIGVGRRRTAERPRIEVAARTTKSGRGICARSDLMDMNSVQTRGQPFNMGHDFYTRDGAIL